MGGKQNYKEGTCFRPQSVNKVTVKCLKNRPVYYAVSGMSNYNSQNGWLFRQVMFPWVQQNMEGQHILKIWSSQSLLSQAKQLRMFTIYHILFSSISPSLCI
jgi:hypothetical protein